MGCRTLDSSDSSVQVLSSFRAGNWLQTVHFCFLQTSISGVRHKSSPHVSRMSTTGEWLKQLRGNESQLYLLLPFHLTSLSLFLAFLSHCCFFLYLSLCLWRHLYFLAENFMRKLLNYSSTTLWLVYQKKKYEM